MGNIVKWYRTVLNQQFPLGRLPRRGQRFPLGQPSHQPSHHGQPSHLGHRFLLGRLILLQDRPPLLNSRQLFPPPGPRQRFLRCCAIQAHRRTSKLHARECTMVDGSGSDVVCGIHFGYSHECLWLSRRNGGVCVFVDGFPACLCPEPFVGLECEFRYVPPTVSL